MKKFFACLLILLIFSGCIFWIGWTQIKIKNDEVGIVVSKTSGISETPVVPGKLSWYWQFLLPTNAQIKHFSIKPLNLTKTITGQLPSADFYTGYNFTYSFSYDLTVTTSPEAIVELYKKNIITSNEDLNTYLSNGASAIAQLTTNYLLKKIEDNPKTKIESIRREDILRSIKFYEEYPELELSVFAITDSKIPDYQLFNKLQSQAITASAVIQKTDLNTDTILEEDYNE